MRVSNKKRLEIAGGRLKFVRCTPERNYRKDVASKDNLEITSM